MADVEPMTIVVPEHMADRIRATIESGEYNTATEAVLDAVALWSARREAAASADVERLRQAWDEGIASGGTEPYDMKSILAEARSTPASASRG